MTYQYNGKSYILQDRLYYRVTEESVIVDKNMLRTQEPVSVPILPVSVPILPVFPVLTEPVLPEQIMIKKKR